MEALIRWIVLAVSLVLYAAHPIGAVTITEGWIMAGVPNDFRPAFDVRGTEGYALAWFNPQGDPMHVWTAQHTLGTTVDLSGTSSVHGPADIIGRSPAVTGSLTFHIDPIVWQPSVTTPFTVTGVLNGTEVDGAGTLAIALYPTSPATYIQQTTFTFADGGAPLAETPEPATLFLVGSGLVAAGVWHRRRRR